MAVCCDYRFEGQISTFSEEFPRLYKEQRMFAEAHTITAACSGCMYGSFPEISISARYYKPLVERAILFLKPQKNTPLKPYSAVELKELAHQIYRESES
jgi:hypothetical protein